MVMLYVTRACGSVPVPVCLGMLRSSETKLGFGVSRSCMTSVTNKSTVHLCGSGLGFFTGYFSVCGSSKT